jgi:hypothetical protein
MILQGFMPSLRQGNRRDNTVAVPGYVEKTSNQQRFPG